MKDLLMQEFMKEIFSLVLRFTFIYITVIYKLLLYLTLGAWISVPNSGYRYEIWPVLAPVETTNFSFIFKIEWPIVLSSEIEST